MPFEIQHESQLRWDRGEWNFIARHESLDRCVLGIKRICNEPGRNPDHYRIVKRNARGKVIETFDAQGVQTDGFLVKPNPIHAARKRRVRVAA